MHVESGGTISNNGRTRTADRLITLSTYRLLKDQVYPKHESLWP